MGWGDVSIDWGSVAGAGAAGAGLGSALGSIVPGLGTVVGGAVGTIVGTVGALGADIADDFGMDTSLGGKDAEWKDALADSDIGILSEAGTALGGTSPKQWYATQPANLASDGFPVSGLAHLNDIFASALVQDMKNVLSGTPAQLIPVAVEAKKRGVTLKLSESGQMQFKKSFIELSNWYKKGQVSEPLPSTEKSGMDWSGALDTLSGVGSALKSFSPVADYLRGGKGSDTSSAVGGSESKSDIDGGWL